MTSKRLGITLTKIFVLSFVGYFTLFSAAASAQGADDGAPIAAVLDGIREALNEAQSNNISGFPPLTKVKIAMHSKAETVTGGGMTFLIFTIGSKKVTEDASTLTLEMVPPTTKDVPTAAAAVADLSLALTRAIQIAKVGILDANNGVPPLDTAKVLIEIKFTVNKTRNGSIDSGDLLPLGLNANRNASRNQVHSVELTFSRDTSR